jgi:periplasmic protein TonB
MPRASDLPVPAIFPEPESKEIMAVRRFLTDLPPESASRSSTPAGAITVSVLLHAALVAVLSLAVFRAVAEESYQPPAMPARLVYSVSAGGGASPKGGDKIPAPRQMAQVVAQRPIVAPAARPVPQPSVTPPPQIAPEPLPSLSTLAPSADVGVREAVGTLAGLPSGSVGPGSGPLPGDGGQDRGLGGDRGNRAGRGTGDEGELPGNGVSWPKLVREIKPNYTPEAMRAQIEGLVELEIVVLPDGSVGTVNIKRSLDSRFGLDSEAIKAVRLWRFDPSRRGGKAAVLP